MKKYYYPALDGNDYKVGGDNSGRGVGYCFRV